MAEEQFTLFWNGPFSQWEPSLFRVGEHSFSHAEQFMMYAKATLFGDSDCAANILAATTPKEMKALGRQAKGFDAGIWNVFREGVVYTGSYAKYTQNPELCTTLLATRGTTLAEASPYDKVWGIGLGKNDPRAKNRSEWQGLNLLGQTLTRVREAIAFERQHVGRD